jgi:hypothetical protein
MTLQKALPIFTILAVLFTKRIINFEHMYIRQLRKAGQIIAFLMLPFVGIAQEPLNKLQFLQGQVISIKVNSESIVSQEAMGQAIDFTVHATVDHGYVVTNATADNTTLHHDIQRISFKFDGMGQEKAFDSQNPKDMAGEMGDAIKETLSKSYDVIIDPTGKVLMSKPETITLSKSGDATAVISSMLQDQTNIVFPPKKNEAGFFKILPDAKVDINAGWLVTKEVGDEKSSTAYTLTAITDSTIVIDFKGTSSTLTKAQMMGMETTTKMNDNFTGTIIVDKKTGIMREKTTITESNGTTEAMGGVLPVTAKSKVVITVTLK